MKNRVCLFSSFTLGVSLLFLLAMTALPSRSRAALIVFSNLTTAGTSGYAEPVGNNLLVGDSLNLTQGGALTAFGASLFNSNTSPGPILAGSMQVNFYDNTTPYAGPGPITNPLLGSAILPWDFTDIGGLNPGQFDVKTFDLSSLGINLPMNILVTQQFTQTAGTATSIGAVLLSDPTIGTSPNTFFLSSTVSPANLYIRSPNPGQFGYLVEVTPEPSMAVCLVAVAGISLFRRRRGVN